MYAHFLNYRRSPLPTGCPFPSELGLDCPVVADKALYSRVFSVSTMEIWGRIILSFEVCGAMYIMGCLAASLVSSH